MDRLARLLLRSDWPDPVVCAFAHINPHMAMYDGQAVHERRRRLAEIADKKVWRVTRREVFSPRRAGGHAEQDGGPGGCRGRGAGGVGGAGGAAAAACQASPARVRRMASGAASDSR